jgi:hypothetical protein
MSSLSPPKWTYGHQKTIFYGSLDTFPDCASITKRISRFRLFLEQVLEQNQIDSIQYKEQMYNTGGHSDIEYYALVLVNEEGGG